MSFCQGSHWKIINTILRSSEPLCTSFNTVSISCLITFCSVAPGLVWALSLCEYHELSSIVRLHPRLEKDLEEMTQVLKLQRAALSAPPPLSSSTSCCLVFFSFPCLCLLYSHTFSRTTSVLSSPLLTPLSSLMFLFFLPLSPPFIPFPLFVTSASSLPGDLQRRKEASPFSLLLNTCSGYNVWKESLLALSQYISFTI